MDTEDGWDIASKRQQSLSHDKSQSSKKSNIENMDPYSQQMNQSVATINSLSRLFEMEEEDDSLMNVKGLKYSMEILGHQQPSQDQYMKMLQLVDYDADGLISFDEFVVAAQNQVSFGFGFGFFFFSLSFSSLSFCEFVNIL